MELLILVLILIARLIVEAIQRYKVKKETERWMAWREDK